MELHLGQKIGSWEIVAEAPAIKSRLGRNLSTFRCRCECGTTRVIRASDLKLAKSKSCGCSKRKPGLSGIKRFGKWTVIKPIAPINGEPSRSECKCDCGVVRVVKNVSLRNGRSKSCGCSQLERVSTHLLTNSTEYHIWNGIRQRCTNPKSKDYKNYGGRGIKVCAEWDSFITFLQDMGRRPDWADSIDRKDSDGDYTKENCRWATNEMQARNRRGNVFVEHSGRLMTLAEYGEINGVRKDTMHKRASYLRARGKPITALNLLNFETYKARKDIKNPQ